MKLLFFKKTLHQCLNNYCVRIIISELINQLVPYQIYFPAPCLWIMDYFLFYFTMKQIFSNPLLLPYILPILVMVRLYHFHDTHNPYFFGEWYSAFLLFSARSLAQYISFFSFSTFYWSIATKSISIYILAFTNSLYALMWFFFKNECPTNDETLSLGMQCFLLQSQL